MSASHDPTAIPPGAEERAFMARLVALNTLFEAARAGTPARGFGAEAARLDALLERYYRALTNAGAPASLG